MAACVSHPLESAFTRPPLEPRIFEPGVLDRNGLCVRRKEEEVEEEEAEEEEVEEERGKRISAKCVCQIGL